MSEILRVRVKPNARKTEILKRGNCWEIAVAAPADKDKANRELIRFLSRELKRRVQIKSGLRGREKLLLLN